VGIGKTRLWQAWSSGLGHDVTALEARCLEATQGLPFAPLTDLLGNQACVRSLLGAGSPLPRVWLAELARLWPHLRASQPDLPAPPGVPPDEERRRVFEALTQVFLALLQSGSALVFFLDDLHWADRSTLAWLEYLVARLRDAPLVVVAAYRAEEASPPLERLLAAWTREGRTRRLSLARLDATEAAALIAALGVRPADAHRVQAAGAGNPLFLVELWRAAGERAEAGAGEQVPARLADLVRARLARLPESARQVLQAAAVLEPDFDFATLRRTSGRNDEETLDALDALLRAAVLEERGSRYAFCHLLVGAVVREQLSGARRAFLHRRAAEALQAAHAGRLDQVAAPLALHYAEAGEVERAAFYAERAAEQALALAAQDEAVAFYHKAVELSPTPGRYLALGRALLRQVDLAGAQAAFQSALEGYELRGDREGVASACLSLAETYFPMGRFDLAQAWMQRSLAYFVEEGDLRGHAMAHLALGVGRLSEGSPEGLSGAEAELREALRLAEEGRVADAGMQAAFMLGNALAERGDLPAARAAFRRSIELARESGDDFQEALALNNAAYHALLDGDLSAAHQLVESGLALAEQRALRLPLQHLYSTRGEIALADADWDEAEAWLTRAMQEAEQSANLSSMANARANLGLAARGRGDLDGALRLLEAARALAAEQRDIHLQVKLDLHLAETLLQRGDLAAAEGALAYAEARLAGSQRQGLAAWAERLRQRAGRQR
jgi:tetratricopeptide (TPR) repeat protein